MKQRQIEKIPYITAPGIIDDKKTEYVAVTAWKNIGKERHILLDVYKNKQDFLKVPVARYAATKKDWGIFFPDKGIWTRQGIKNNKWSGGMCWDCLEISINENNQERRERNRLYSDDDLKRIENFFGGKKEWMEWWGYFENNEKDIKHEAWKKKQRKREVSLQERIANTPALPEAELLAWADMYLFNEGHYLYYKKHGPRADICCSKCGGFSVGRWKEGQSYESQYERRIKEPRRGHMGRCSLCGAYGKYKPQGEATRERWKECHVFMTGRYKSDGAVIRYINLRKEWFLEKFIGEKGESEMLRSYEKLSGIEVARAYFEPGRKTQTDYYKCSTYEGKDFWDDCNLGGMSNIAIGNAVLYPGMDRELQGTCLQYSAIGLYAGEKKEVNAIEYLKRYQEFPQIEMLVKMGLYKAVDEMVAGRCGIVYNSAAHSLDRFLGIQKKHIRLLKKNKGDPRIIRLLQIEESLGEDWTEAQVMALQEIGVDAHSIKLATDVMTMQKALNLIAKYAGCGYGTGCGAAESRLRNTATTYFDYLSMRKELGYDLANTVYQRPRDLEAAHNSMVEEKDREKTEKRIQEAEERFPEIRKRYRSLRKRYYYEDETYLIRPAKSAEEIIKEGRILHHCVGGDTYLRKHNDGVTAILLLRYRDREEIPYITVEIEGTKIRQWYGAHDNKPDEKIMQKWLDNYITRLMCAGEPAGNPKEEIRVMVG